MLIGYARVSTDDQNLDLQRDALRLTGCEKIYEDRMSGAKAARPGLAMALEVARAGDVLTVWRLDRLGRSLHDLIELARRLEEAGIGLMSVQEKIDTSSSGGRLVFHMFGALAEIGLALIIARTKAGLAAARARGRDGGAPFKLTAAKLRSAQAATGKPETKIGPFAANSASPGRCSTGTLPPTDRYGSTAPGCWGAGGDQLPRRCRDGRMIPAGAAVDSLGVDRNHTVMPGGGRASTPFHRDIEDLDGRDKPGHDGLPARSKDHPIRRPV